MSLASGTVPVPAAQAGGSRKSTFFWPMLLLPPSQRAAMFAIYRFCRAVDDIADEPGPREGRQQELAAWRERIHRLYADETPELPGSEALLHAIRRYGLPRAEMEAVIDGVAMDLDGPIRAPALAELQLYCRRVAGAVGLLAIRVFDRADDETEAFALALGEAMQLTNILRDLAADAAIARLYLPREILAAAGIAETHPAKVLAAPNLPAACEALADLAEARYAEAEALLARWPRRRLWSARAMMLLYRRLLARLRARGWADLALRPASSTLEGAGLTLRCLLGCPPRR